MNTHQANVKVTDESGIHARPATLLVQKAKKYTSEISITMGDKKANPKNLMQLLALGASLGSELTISATGDDAEAAVKDIASAIANGLDKKPETNANTDSKTSENKKISLNPIVDNESNKFFSGINASAGISMANISIFHSERIPTRQTSTQPADEIKSLEKAIATAITQLEELHKQMLVQAPQEAEIFKAHILVLKDDDIKNNVLELINQQSMSAEWSWYTVLKNQADAFKKLTDPILKARYSDMVDVQQRVIAILENRPNQPIFPETPFILVAEELTPSQTAYLKDSKIVGICTALGGPNSHMAILSRALGLPALVGMGNDILNIADNTLAILDSAGAKLYVNPSQNLQKAAQETINIWEKIREEELKTRFEPAKTEDGFKIDVVCNIASVNDAKSVLERGGEGVGLMRTEFLFENRKVEPTEEEQFQALRAISKELKGSTFIIRTLDIGGDKQVAYLPMLKEDNPFLGVRGIRLCLKFEDMFRRQLRAIYRLVKEQETNGEKPNIWVMFPMIATLSELMKAKRIAEEIRAELNAPKVPLGIMVEVPSAAIIADVLAEHADFFSIGSNDLTQYTLAMDRMHPELAKQADSYHPSILRLIEMTVAGAKKYNRMVAVCGNMAADPMMASILIGLGVTELSVSPANVPGVKLFIRSSNMQNLREKAQLSLKAKTASEVKNIYS